MPAAHRPAIDDVVRRHEPELMQVPGVTGVGVSWEEPGQQAVILVFRADPTPDAASAAGPGAAAPSALPDRLEGWPVKVVPPLTIG